MERLKNPKVLIALTLATLAVIVFLQNRAEIALRALWLAEIHTTVATALSCTFIAGVVTGALGFSRWKSRREKAKQSGPAQTPTP
ncbi:MAG: hypothetical protein EXS08_08385 [Planctomycetes bacterium]|nr:hypothetical protein [Planctomycetota bacterium]